MGLRVGGLQGEGGEGGGMSGLKDCLVIGDQRYGVTVTDDLSRSMLIHKVTIAFRVDFS